MAYVNTGTKRSLTYTVTKTVGGVPVAGTGGTYDGRLAFLTYAALTQLEAQQLTDLQFSTRLAAFHDYVESLEPGFDSGTDMTNAATVVDLTTCPPPPTTTTTTAAATTTTTAAVTTTTTAAVTTTTTAAVTTTTTAAITTTTTTV